MQKYRNLVQLVGRVSGEPKQRELPSGDTVVEFRMIIERDDREGVDTIDVAAWKASLRKKALRFKGDDWLSLKGVLRRRFWRSPTGIASRWQVEARELLRL